MTVNFISWYYSSISCPSDIAMLLVMSRDAGVDQGRGASPVQRTSTAGDASSGPADRHVWRQQQVHIRLVHVISVCAKGTYISNVRNVYKGKLE